MSVRIWLARPDSLKVLSRVLIGFIAASSVLAGFWLVRFAISSFAERSSKAAAKSSFDSISSVRADLLKFKSLEIAPEYNGMQPVVQLQAAVEKAANDNQCELAEFQAAPDVSPYLSRFQKKSDASEWLQIEVKLSLRGQPDDIIEALKSIGKGPCIIEFNGVDLMRDEAKTSEGAVQAKVSLRVLTKRLEAKG